MKNKIISIIIAVSIALPFLCPAFGQSVALTQYFQPGYSMRHKLNPALLPQWGYVNMPALGALSVTAGSNLGLSNFLFPLQNGEMGTFMHPDVSDEQFLSKLKDMNYLQTNVDISLISFGWYWGRSFWSVDVSAHTDVNVNLPYELLRFVKTEMDKNPTEYNIRDISASANAYMSVALGYARAITPSWRVGAKLKFIYSGVEADIMVPRMDIYMSDQQWKVSSDARARIAGGIARFSKNGDTVNGINLDFDPSSFGYGAAIDLGFEVRPNAVRGFRLSLGVTDLGFVYYKKESVQTAMARGEVVFDGFDNIGTEMNTDQETADLKEGFKDMIQLIEEPNNSSYCSMLQARLNAGLEYDFFLDKFSIGLLSSTLFNPDRISTELTVSLNMKLLKWLSMSVSYSFLQTHQTIGWALNITPKWGLNLFLASDYTPVVTNSYYMPINKAHVNVAIGLSIPIGNNTLSDGHRKANKAELEEMDYDSEYDSEYEEIPEEIPEEELKESKKDKKSKKNKEVEEIEKIEETEETEENTPVPSE